MARKIDASMIETQEEKTSVLSHYAYKPSSTWELSENARRAHALAMCQANTQHGLYATIPLVCKGDKCPYASTCLAVQHEYVSPGGRCPIEIAVIEKLFADYTKYFDIKEDNVVDMNLVRDLIDAIVMIGRCESLLSSEADIIKDVCVGLTQGDEGNMEPVFRPEIHKAIDIKERYVDRKNKVWQLLNATRKDKAKTETGVAFDASTYATMMRRRGEELSKAAEVAKAEAQKADELAGKYAYVVREPDEQDKKEDED